MQNTMPMLFSTPAQMTQDQTLQYQLANFQPLGANTASTVNGAASQMHDYGIWGRNSMRPTHNHTQQHQQQQVIPEAPKRSGTRLPLGALPANWEDQAPMSPTPMTDSPTDPAKSLSRALADLITRERFNRNKLIRMEVNGSARLEMKLQNINIKKYTSHEEEAPESTPRLRDRVVSRDVTVSGKPIYTFKAGEVGGMCVYFLKGFCSLGNKCRYVHDECDDGRFVKITGMPYDASASDVIDFFSPISLAFARITFIFSQDCRPSGSAIIEFTDRKEALLAQSKDRTFFTVDRYVLLYPSSRMEKIWHEDNNNKRMANMQPKLMQMPAAQAAHAAAVDHNNNKSAHSTPLSAQHSNSTANSPIMRQMMQGTPMMSTPSVMGLTPSPAMPSVASAATPASPCVFVQAHAVPVAQKTPQVPAFTQQEDDTMRSLLSTLDEVDDDVPPLALMDAKEEQNLEWISQLNASLAQQRAPRTVAPPAPPAPVAPANSLFEALSGLGYSAGNCAEIVQTLTAKCPVGSNDHDGMPTLLPIA